MMRAMYFKMYAYRSVTRLILSSLVVIMPRLRVSDKEIET